VDRRGAQRRRWRRGAQGNLVVVLTLPAVVPQEDEYLIASVQKYGVKRWAQIAQGLPGRTSKACSHRWGSTACLPGPCPPALREAPGRPWRARTRRWRTYLAPGVKHTSTDPFTDWEIAVVQEVRALGASAAAGGAHRRDTSAHPICSPAAPLRSWRQLSLHCAHAPASWPAHALQPTQV